jgi:hypothetical protein
MKNLIARLRVFFSLLLILAGFAGPAQAGGSGESKVGVEKFGDDAIRSLALKVNDELDRRKVNVAIIARSGRVRKEMPRGISYTHVAFVVFEPVNTPDAAVTYTYTVYNLYQGDQGRDDRSYLRQDVVYDFVAGTAEEDVAICVPTEALQRRILAVIRSPAYRSLHHPEYNIVANPWVDRYDNCVTHSLKVCVAAIYQTDDAARINEDIRLYFKPTRIHLGPLTSLGSSFVTGFSRADMDRSGLQTATYESLRDFLLENHLATECFTVAMR